MNDYISRDTAICVADYAADEHPYDKDPAKPETYSGYNQGWHDACDHIRERLENIPGANCIPMPPEAEQAMLLAKAIKLLQKHYTKAPLLTAAVLAGDTSADITTARPELKKAIELLEKNYERGLDRDFVRDPIAWALYQTWKEIDGGADNG